MQIVGEDRPGTGHLQRVPQTFLGLVEPLSGGLQGANEPFGLATLASDRLAAGLSNAPRPLALGRDAALLDTLAGQGSQGRCGTAAPVGDQQRGSGVRTKNRAVPCQGLPGHRRFVHHAAAQRPTHLAPPEATEQIRQAKLDLLPRLVAHQRPCLRHTNVHNCALGHPPSGDPLHNLRAEPLGHLVHRLQRGPSVWRHTGATRAEPLAPPAGLHDPLPPRGEQARQHLALGLCALGTQLVCFDRPEERLHLGEGRIAPPTARVLSWARARPQRGAPPV